MINEQILLWIKTNASVYLKGKLADYFNQSQGTVQISDIFKKVISITFKVMETRLKESKEATIQNLISFYLTKTQSNNKTTQKSLSFCLIGKSRSQVLVPLLQSPQHRVVNKAEICQICKQVASLLWLQDDLVRQILQIYSKAICDLIASGKQISLNFGFCLVNLSRNKSTCKFKKEIIKYFDQKQNKRATQFKENTHIWLQLPSKECSVSQSQRWVKNWQLIKQANLFDYPSLKQVQNHLNKGYDLQLKYKKKHE